VIIEEQIAELKKRLGSEAKNVQNLFAAHNALATLVEKSLPTLAQQVRALTNILARVRVRRGGPDQRVCNLCLANDASGGIITTSSSLILFDNEQYGKICADCAAVVNAETQRVRDIGKQVREKGS